MSSSWKRGFDVFRADGTNYMGSTPVERQAPPSTYAVAAFIDKQQGSFGRMVMVTLLRSVFIFPGVYGSGKLLKLDLSPWQIGALTLASSSTITAGMLAWYYLKSKVVGMPTPMAMGGLPSGNIRN